MLCDKCRVLVPTRAFYCPRCGQPLLRGVRAPVPAVLMPVRRAITFHFTGRQALILLVVIAIICALTYFVVPM